MSWVGTVLARREHDFDYEKPLENLRNERVLVTGANGSLGSRLVPILEEREIHTYATDLGEMDVRDSIRVQRVIDYFKPTVIFHLAGWKQAPDGEDEPAAVAETNISGTANIVEYAGDAHVIVASTCKACEAETVYGASKLICERIVLNAGGSVARLYNVVDTGGNVFEGWQQIPEDEPIPVTRCVRFFISAAEAIGLLLWTSSLPSGRRYAVNPLNRRSMASVAQALYADRERWLIPPRRGDRVDELLCSRSESMGYAFGAPSGMLEIRGNHDGVRDKAAA